MAVTCAMADAFARLNMLPLLPLLVAEVVAVEEVAVVVVVVVVVAAVLARPGKPRGPSLLAEPDMGDVSRDEGTLPQVGDSGEASIPLAMVDVMGAASIAHG